MKKLLTTDSEHARCNGFLKQSARVASLTEKFLPQVRMLRSLLCSKAAQKPQARSRAQVMLTE